MAGLRWGATSDTGRVRPVNQDSVLAELPLFAVADGMGGHAAGEVASQLALGIARQHLGPGRRPTLDDLVDSVAMANRTVFEQARRRPELRGMGTTFCALSLLAGENGAPDRLAVVNVGDSRGYVLRATGLHQVTRDHSYVEDLVEAGEITPAEARTHPQRHIVTRALGVEPNVLVDTWELSAAAGERYLLCSDGLTNELDDDEIEVVLRAQADPQDAADRLVHLANQRGARDNVTVVVVDVIDDGFVGRIEVPAPPAGMVVDDLRQLAVGSRSGATTQPSWVTDDAVARDGLPTDPDDLEPPVGRPLAPPIVTAAPPLAPAGRAPTVDAPSRRGRRGATGPSRTRTFLRNGLFLVVLAAIAVFALLSVRAYGRAGWYVTFRNDQVTLYQGKPEGVLWVKPVAKETYGVKRADLAPEWRDKIDARISFTSAAAAQRWAQLLKANPDAAPGLVVATTTTTTVITLVPTTVVPTTVVPTTTGTADAIGAATTVPIAEPPTTGAVQPLTGTVAP